MAENPSGYFPDFLIAFDPQLGEEHVTEILRSRNLREQRRVVGPTDGLRRFSASSSSLKQADRKTVRDFLRSKRGRFGAFYFFVPVPEDAANLAIGSVTAATSIIAPFKGPWWTSGTPVAASITSVLVGGASVAFTVTPNIGSGGEDRINFSAAQTGAVTVTGSNIRHRIIARYDADIVSHRFIQNTADVRAIFQIVIQELVP